MAIKMYILLGSFVLLCLYNTVDAGQCFNIWAKNDNIGEKLYNKVADQCPVLLGLAAEYCCYNFKLEPHCCEIQETIINWIIIAVVVILLLSVISFVCSCLCCKCR